MLCVFDGVRGPASIPAEWLSVRDARYTAVFRCTGTYRGTISEYRYTAAPNDRGLSYDSRRRSINTTSTSPTSLTSPTRQHQ